VATENDALNGVCMLFGHLLTGTAQLFADVRTYWSNEAIERVTGYDPAPDLREMMMETQGIEDALDDDDISPFLQEMAAEMAETLPGPDGILHLINSGPAALDWTGAMEDEDGFPVVKRWHEVTPDDAQACLGATKWCPSATEYFPGGGWSTDFTTSGGLACTMFRLNLVKGLGPVLQIAEGFTVDLPDEVHDALDERTNPTWPTTWFVPNLTGTGPFADVYSVMNHWGANHGAIAPGHIGADLIALAAMLRIPVEMHNVPEAELFRPASWSRFGALEPQSADYRACAAYGPLYR